MRFLEVGKIEKVALRLGDAALDPGLWPELMEEISNITGATGAVLFQGDVRTADVPRTAGADEMITNYFRDNWHTRDLRAARGVPRLLVGEAAVTDQDLITPDEMRHEAYYNEMLRPYGFRWFAGVGFWASSVLWALCIQRQEKEGPFEADDKRILAALAPRLTAAATLSTVVGRRVIAGIGDALDLVSQPALVLDRVGSVLGMNSAAESVFDDDVRVHNRRIVVRDPTASARLAALIGALRLAGDAAPYLPARVVARRGGNSPMLIRVMSIPAAARSPFLGASALVTLSELEPFPGPASDIIAEAFGLTPAEARLASLIASGTAPSVAARRLGISRETARNQLKAVFGKTDTHRQGELVALLSRLQPAHAE